MICIMSIKNPRGELFQRPRGLPKNMDRNHLIFFRFRIFVDYFHIQDQQNSIALLMLMLHYEQTFLGLGAVFRRRRFRFHNRLRLRNPPWPWALPRSAESRFEIHFHDRNIPEDYFRRQLRMDRNTFQALLGILGPWITRQNTRFRNCTPPEKVLALGIYRLANGNSYVSIGPVFNVGKATVIKTVLDVVGALFELKDE